MAPVLCFVTTGDGSLAPARIAAAARAGVPLVQIRAPQLEGRALHDIVVHAVDAVRGTRARIVVNDRLDVALAAGAHGVHLRSTSFDARRARAHVPSGFLIGRSVHSVDDATASSAGGGLDYLIFGTVFETSSKPGVAPTGLDALRRVVKSTPLPVLAIGGITLDRLADVAATGAAGVAAIGLFEREPPEGIEAVVREARARFAAAACS